MAAGKKSARQRVTSPRKTPASKAKRAAAKERVKSAPMPAAPERSFREDVAALEATRAEEFRAANTVMAREQAQARLEHEARVAATLEDEGLLDAQKRGAKALAIFVQNAHDEQDRLGRLLEGASAPMICGPGDNWYHLARIVAGAIEACPRATIAGLEALVELQLLVDTNGHVTMRRGIGKVETIPAWHLRAWVERRDLKPKQHDLALTPVKPIGLFVDEWKAKKGWTLQTETYFIDLSEDHVREVKDASHGRQLLFLRKRMRVREEIQEDFDESVFIIDRMDFLRWILARED